MSGALYQFLADDHDRLEAILESALSEPDAIDMERYSEFRKGLLKHIAIEEKIVLPAIAEWQGGRKAEVAERLRLDHGAIAALLVPPPTASIVRTLRSILTVHNALEEKEGGLYGLFEHLAGVQADRLLAAMKAAPEVAVLPHAERPDILTITKQAVERAGYVFESE